MKGLLLKTASLALTLLLAAGLLPIAFAGHVYADDRPEYSSSLPQLSCIEADDGVGIGQALPDGNQTGISEGESPAAQPPEENESADNPICGPTEDAAAADALTEEAPAYDSADRSETAPVQAEGALANYETPAEPDENTGDSETANEGQDSSDNENSDGTMLQPLETLASYRIIYLLEELSATADTDDDYSFETSSASYSKPFEPGGGLVVSWEDLAELGEQRSFTGFSYRRVSQPEKQADGSYIVTVYYSRNSYYLRLHGWNWGIDNYAPIATGDDSYNVTRIFQYGESLMEFRQSNPLQKTWSLTRAPAGSSQTPTPQQQFSLPTVMPDPAQLVDDSGPFANGQNNANTLDLWDYMSSFGPGQKQRYENRVYVYLEKLPSTSGQPGGSPGGNGSGRDNKDNYLPASPAYFDVTLMTGQQPDALNAYLQEQRPGFTVNRQLSSDFWLPGAGAEIFAPGNPGGWGNTDNGADMPAQYIEIYYMRNQVSVAFYLAIDQTPVVIDGKYGEALFSGERTDIAAINEVINMGESEFLGWYTSPNGHGGNRVDAPEKPSYLGSFPSRSISLFAHFKVLEPFEPTDPVEPTEPTDPTGPTDPAVPNNPDAPDSQEEQDLPDPPGGGQNSPPLSATGQQESAWRALSSSGTSSPAPDSQQGSEDDGSADGQATDADSQVLPEDKTPTIFPQEEVLAVLQKSPEGWSYGNALVSLLIMVQATYAIGRFFYQSRRNQLNLWGKNFLLRIVALGIGLVAVVVTSVTSDFSKPAVFVDKASLPIVMLLVIQQLIMVGLVRTRPANSIGEKKPRRFRAEKRFDD